MLSRTRQDWHKYFIVPQSQCYQPHLKKYQKLWKIEAEYDIKVTPVGGGRGLKKVGLRERNVHLRKIFSIKPSIKWRPPPQKSEFKIDGPGFWKITRDLRLNRPHFWKYNTYFSHVGIRVFSDISERNNDYSDTLDFRRGEVGVVTFFG